jgi:hypothetical protein
VSHAEVTLPADFPTPPVLRELRRASLIIENVEQLADLRPLYFIRFLHTGDEYIVPFVHLQDTLRTASGDYTIVIDPRDDQRVLESLLGTTPRLMFD